MVSYITVQEPAFYKVARESGAIDKFIEERDVMFSHRPYQRLRQLAILTGSIAAILWTFNLPEKVSVTFVCIALSAVSLLAYCIFAEEMKKLHALHDEIVLRTHSVKVL